MLKNAALSLVAVLVSLLFAEFIAHRFALGPAYVRSLQTWASYDTRSRLQFVLDSRSEGRDAFPAPNALLFIKTPLMVRGERVVPLGGVTNAFAVGGSEGGYHSAFATDEAGFNNSKGTWPLADARNVFLVGDSFTYGDCVRQGEDVASRLRERVTHVVNLGARGNGPLQQLATIREYVPPGQVGYVFWMFYERNDLIDLRDAKADPVLMGYLDEGFSQDLLARRAQVDAALRGYLEERIAAEQAGRPRVFPALRGMLARLASRKAAADPAHGKEADRSRTAELGKAADHGKAAEERPDWGLFRQVVDLARKEVEAKGGRFVFVYQPSYRRFSGEPLNPWADHKEKVLETVRELGVPVIDIEPHFRETGDPLALFPFRLNGHYNDAGYALVGRVLADYLDRQGSGTTRPAKAG